MRINGIRRTGVLTRNAAIGWMLRDDGSEIVFTDNGTGARVGRILPVARGWSVLHEGPRLNRLARGTDGDSGDPEALGQNAELADAVNALVDVYDRRLGEAAEHFRQFQSWSDQQRDS